MMMQANPGRKNGAGWRWWARVAVLVGLSVATVRAAENTAAGNSVAPSSDGRLQLAEFSRERSIFDSGAQLGRAVARVPVAGSARLPDGEALEARAVSADGADATPWQAVGVVTSGTWSGVIEVPRSPQWFFREVRTAKGGGTAARSTGMFAAGHVWAIYEQSNWARLLLPDAKTSNDPVAFPGDVWIFQRGGKVTEVGASGAFSPSLAALANALSRERPGEKFAIAFHAVSGTSPEDMLTRPDEDAAFGTPGDRNWDDEVALHRTVTADGSPVGLVTINGWIAFGGGKPVLVDKMVMYFLGRDLSGKPVSCAEAGVPRFLTELYDWNSTRLAWIGPHGRNNAGVEGALVKAADDLPGYRTPVDRDYELLVDRIRENFGSSHLPETLPWTMETMGGQRGTPKKSRPDEWGDCAHFNGASKDGREMLARLGMAATLKTLGLVQWPVPVFDRRFNAPSGAYVDFWMEGRNVTTLRRLRALRGELNGVPEKIPARYPHRTEVMGWTIDGRPAERAEIVADAGGSGCDGVRIYPNAGTSHFTADAEVVYGSGSFVGRQITQDDPRDGIHLDYPVVDVGQADLPALPVQPRSSRNAVVR